MDRKNLTEEIKSPLASELNPTFFAVSQKANSIFNSPLSVNLPQNMTPSSSQRQTQTNPSNFELSPKLKEIVIYDEAIIERKQASFENLKKWDNRRSHSLHFHSKFVEMLINRLEQKIEYSNMFMHKIVKFFKEKVNQETEYTIFFQNKLPKFSKLFSENITETSGLFRSFSEVDEMHAKKAQQLETYVGYLEKTILKEILHKENTEFNRKISMFKDRFQEIRKNLSRTNVETAEKSTKYSKLFYEMTEPQSATKTRKNPKDLYNLEMGFLKIADGQSQLQRDLGVEAVAFWKEVMNLEINRMYTIQKVMLNYLVQSENLKGGAKKEFQTLNPEKEVENLYSLRAMFSKEETAALEKNKEGNGFNMEDCFNFLKSLEIERFREDHLILKEIYLERDHGVYNGNQKEFKPCLVVFTIDNNLLIFDEPKKNEYNPANFCLKIEGIKVLPREEEKMAEISAKVAGFLFDSKNRFLFRFENNDKVEEFINYFNFINLKKN